MIETPTSANFSRVTLREVLEMASSLDRTLTLMEQVAKELDNDARWFTLNARMKTLAATLDEMADRAQVIALRNRRR